MNKHTIRTGLLAITAAAFGLAGCADMNMGGMSDTTKRTAIGAGVGGTVGLMRRNQQRRQEAYANDQAMAQYQADMGRYNQAFAACMQGRGYTVR